MEFGGFGGANFFIAQKFDGKRFQHIVSAAAKSDDQEALKFFAMSAGVVGVHFIDARLVNLDFAIRKDELLGVWLAEIGGHLNVFSRAAKKNLPLLGVRAVIDNFVLFAPGVIWL